MPPLLPQSLYPLYAPLPVPMIQHLLLRLKRRKHVSDPQLWDMLLEEVVEKRQAVYYYMDPYVLLESQERRLLALTTKWLLASLSSYSPDQKPVARPTLSHWARTGRVRFEREGHPTPDSAAALLIARMVDVGERNFLPESIHENEPAWWCHAESVPPEKRNFSHPISQLAELPPATVLWTHWAGAAWDPDWIHIQDNKGYSVGAIRFAGIVVQGNVRKWDVTLDDIRLWAPHIAALALDRDEEVLQLLATLTLRHLAVSRIGTTHIDPI